MNSSYARFRYAICLMLQVAALALQSEPTDAAITVSFANKPDNFVDHVDCDGNITPGGTDLIQIKTSIFNAETGRGVLNALNNGYQVAFDKITVGGTEVDVEYDYSYSFGAGLGGELIVHWYKAVDIEVGAICRHGAEITLQYIPNSNETGLEIRWIQVYTEEGGSGNRQNQVDPEPGGHPFYFWKDDPQRFVHVEGLDGILFGDSPSDPHPEKSEWRGTVTFTLFLCTVSTEPRGEYKYSSFVCLHDAITWGYVGYCYPEPSSFVVFGLLAGIGGFFIAWKRRKSNSCP